MKYLSGQNKMTLYTRDGSRVFFIWLCVSASDLPHPALYAAGCTTAGGIR